MTTYAEVVGEAHRELANSAEQYEQGVRMRLVHPNPGISALARTAHRTSGTADDVQRFVAGYVRAVDRAQSEIGRTYMVMPDAMLEVMGHAPIDPQLHPTAVAVLAEAETRCGQQRAQLIRRLGDGEYPIDGRGSVLVCLLDRDHTGLCGYERYDTSSGVQCRVVPEGPSTWGPW